MKLLCGMHGMYNLKSEINMCGYAFEYIARIILRRQRKNNFIFLVNRFDSIQKIVEKYRFDVGKVHKVMTYLARSKCRCDVIEFIVDAQRQVQDIVFYEIKTTRSTRRLNLDVCQSSYAFMKLMQDTFSCDFYVVQIQLLSNWNFTCAVFPASSCSLRIYNSQTSKTVGYQN